MSNVRPLPQKPMPPGDWRQRTDWTVSSLDEAFAVRDAARDLVGPDDDGPDDNADGVGAGPPGYAFVGARVEVTMGELVVNGLRHGRSPVRASLLRGADGWLVVVADGATDQPPLIREVAPEKASGSLGIRMVVALATQIGWFSDADGKHVWALLSDVAPDRLLTALRPRSG